METNNLMLENYVQLDGDTHQVVAISVSYIGLAGGSDKALKKVDASKVKPIELTRKWLDKLGANFHRPKNGKIKWVVENFKPIGKIDSICGYLIHPNGFHFEGDYTYVHEVQNWINSNK